MEAVLECYMPVYNPKEPVLCFDETSKQLIAETCIPIPMKSGLVMRYNCECERRGTRNLFLFFEPPANWRKLTVTKRRTKQDFAQQMKILVDELILMPIVLI